MFLGSQFSEKARGLLGVDLFQVERRQEGGPKDHPFVFLPSWMGHCLVTPASKSESMLVTLAHRQLKTVAKLVEFTSDRARANVSQKLLATTSHLRASWRTCFLASER